MTKFTAFVIIVALRIFYPPSHAQTGTTPFTGPAPLPASSISKAPAKLISLNGIISNNKVILNWVVASNETADQFEIEKSVDGKNFTMAALVFGTDKPEMDNYQFYEKAGKQKVSYRIKLINKDHQAEYSAIIEINPNI